MFLLIALFGGLCHGFLSDSQGPQFLHDFVPELLFSSQTGGHVDCMARGQPSPVITWTTVPSKGHYGASVNPVSSITGLRHVLENGSLIFPPFSAEQLRPTIHQSIYRCVASNPSGRIVSPDIHVKAVVWQNFEAVVYDQRVYRGDTAVFRCHIPASVRNHVAVTSWVQEGGYDIFPSVTGDGRHLILPNGDLHVLHVGAEDAQRPYKCRVIDKITGQSLTSTPGKLMLLTDSKVISAPRLAEVSQVIKIRAGEDAALPCLAFGQPKPSVRWLRQVSDQSQLTPVMLGERQRLLGSSLYISSVLAVEGGRYVCVANNTAGGAEASTLLVVQEQLRAHVDPPLLIVDATQSAVFRCVAAGQPKLAVVWLKNGQRLYGNSHVVLGDNGYRLRVLSMQREDQGMYQCVLSNEDDSAQGYAELRLGAFPPKLVYTFIRQTVQPGPSVSLKCSAVGNPVPHFTWALDGFPLPLSERFMIGQYVSVHGEVISHVNISSVHVEDGGNYQCQAENRAGGIAHSAPLHVFGAPYVRPMGKVQAVASGRFELICPAAGYPIESIVWEKDGRQLPTNLRQRVFPNGTLVIDPVERLSDKGTYHCEARNRQGHSAKQSVHIDVIDPPQIMPLSVPMGLNLGDRLALQCVVTKGDLPLAITWEKDGALLDSVLDAATRSINAFTSSLFVESLNLGHAGIYTCVAANHAGKVSQLVNVTINVPPRISPFSFPDLTQGSRVQVSCSVYEGDPPFTFQWIKDQNRIMPDNTGIGSPLPHLRVTDFNEYSSILTMDHVTAVHDGQYTCVASNAASHGQHSAYLRVSVPPEWVIEPRDVHVMAGHSAELNCAAKGFPEPTINWRYTLDKSKGQFGSLMDSRFQVESNGTLLIRTVVKNDEGYYLCEAQNSIGSGLSSVILLTVNAPPKIASHETKVSVRKSTKATIKCEVQGDLPLYVHWKKDGINFEPSYRDSARYEIRERQSKGTVSELNIANVNTDDGGHYECWTSNAHGQDRLDFELQVQDIPQKPQDLRLQEVSSRHIMLGWTIPHDGHSPLTEFVIFYKQSSDESYRPETIPPNQSWGVVTGLRPATMYHFYVTAGNAVGTSVPSDTVTALTEEEAPAGPPVEVSVGAMTSRDLRVTWSPPQLTLRNGVIIAYSIGIKEAGDTSGKPYNISVTQMALSERMDWRLSGLRPYTLYAVVVQAFNSKGQGPFSTEVMARTLEDAPDGPPRELTCVALSSQSLQVTWQAPVANQRNGIIQGYKIFYELIPSDLSYELVETEVKMTSELSVYLSVLMKFANYSVQVLAFTRIGDGMISSPMHCLTAEDVPDPPAGIKAVISSHDAIVLTWLSPSQANGRILRFAVFIREIDSQGQEVTSQKKTIQAHMHHYEMRGLRKRTNFLFQVSAFTKAGEGPRSNGINLNFAPSDRVPAAIVSMGSTVLIPWESVIRIPCLTVGDAPLHIRWTKNSGQILIDWTQVSSITASNNVGTNWPVVEGQENNLAKSPNLLSNGTLFLYLTQASDSGNYSCAAKNKFGDDLITYSLTVMVPPAPPTLHYAISDFGSVSLRWSVVEHYKDAHIHGFLIKYRLRGLEQIWKEEKLSFTTRAMKIDNLVCGSEYEFFLMAFNRIGSSEASAVVVAKTKGNPPHWISNHEESFALSTTSITLYFHGWEDGGCPIQQFVIRYRLNSQSDWIVAGTETLPQTSFLLGGLLPSSGYIVRLTVISSAGSTDREYSLSTKALGIENSRPIYREDNNYALGPLLSDPRIAVPIAISILALTLTSVTIGIRLRARRQQQSSPDPKLYNSCSSNEAREEAVYASIGKRSPAKSTLNRHQEDNEEVYPYAVFPTPKLPESGPSPKTFRAFFFDKSEAADLTNFAARPNSEYEYIHPVGHRDREQQRRPRRPLPTAFAPKPPQLQSRLSDSDSELELASNSKTESAVAQLHASAAAQALQSQYGPSRAGNRRQAQLSWHAQETLAMVGKAELAGKESKGQQTTDMTRECLPHQRTFPRRYPPH